MPGFLTPERRQRAKQRSRNNIAGGTKSSLNNNKNRSSKNKLPKPPRSVSTGPDGDGSIGEARTITPTASSESPLRSSSRSSRGGGGNWKDFDETTTEATTPPHYSSPSSRGSPSSYLSRSGSRQSPLSMRPAVSYNNNSSRSAKYSVREEFLYASDEEMPMDEMMGTRKQLQTRSPSPRSSSPSTSVSPKQSVATYRSVTPTQEVSDVLGLSNIMAMVSPSNWNTSDSADDSNGVQDNDGDKNASVGSEEANGASGGKPATTSATGIQRIIAALNSGSTAGRPSNLNREEYILWDSFQTAMINDRNEHLSKRRAVEQDLQKSSSLLDELERREKELEREITEAKSIRADMEQKYTAMAIVVENYQSRKKKDKDDQEESDGEKDIGKRETLNLQLQQLDMLKEELQTKDALLKEQQEGHNTEVRAIQRVLADITTEKNKIEMTMEKQKEQLATAVAEGNNKEEENDAAITTVLKDELDAYKERLEASKEETEEARRETDEKTKEIVALESDLNIAKSQFTSTVDERNRLMTETKLFTDEISNLKNKVEKLESSSKELGVMLQDTKAEARAGNLEIEKLKVEKMEIDVARTSALGDVEKLERENIFLRQENEKLKREQGQAKAQVEKLKEEKTLVEQDVEKLKKEEQRVGNELKELKKAREHAVAEVDKALLEAKAIEADHPIISPSSSIESEDSCAGGVAKTVISVVEFEELKKKLADTTLSLETTKKIIASLESANGSLAVDSRSKIKDKEEELSFIQKESEERKRNLDSLATELRDLQRKQGDVENVEKRTKVQLLRQRALMDHLETTLTDLQAAVVVHESSVSIQKSSFSKNSNIEEISEILGDALYAISSTLEMSEKFIDEFDDSSVSDTNVEYAEINSEVGRYIDTIITNDREATSRGLKHELEQKKVAVKRLEEALKKQNEEMRRMRSQSHHIDNNKLRDEIHRLRQQCSTNMEVLAKKERELSVLRSSLNVDENESGYISDDASDDEDEDGGADVASIMSAAKLSSYSSADAEAYATILSQAHGRIEIPGSQIQEIESLKKDLMEALGEKESASKELQLRRESLANAKMIISSLEKANKAMMEDLRLRLQDSNNAISSLINKSKTQESTTDDLRNEVERLQKEKLEDRENYDAELEKLKNTEGKGGSVEEKKEEVPSFANDL
eukprot:CAMPEP_0197179674 /NCGR_PEP_ID=MMETSP1423-20130617/4541_1 /TAXON_ID=476441 /ORGANISM="Pseudo-nitzschia heimii, Strain UNC1101" /LENGTH=1168 /DNA_ID=CAMNT_0042629615 /DNA_START=271 /DNA_END=3777 /DNA_ORIENTATION=+